MDTILKVSTKEIEFNLGPKEERSFYKLELQNLNPTKNIAFKIKSTNVERYVVSPTYEILEPSQKLTVDIVLHLKPQDLENNEMGDKFAVFYMEVENSLAKEEVEKFLKQNSNKQQKVYVKTKIHRQVEQETASETLMESQQLEQPKEEIQVQRKQDMFTSQDSSYLKFKNDIYEKDQFIQKLKKEKKVLEQNLYKVKQVIENQKSFQNAQKPQTVQNFILFFIFFVGLVIGALFNSY